MWACGGESDAAGGAGEARLRAVHLHASTPFPHRPIVPPAHSPCPSPFQHSQFWSWSSSPCTLVPCAFSHRSLPPFLTPSPPSSLPPAHHSQTVLIIFAAVLFIVDILFQDFQFVFDPDPNVRTPPPSLPPSLSLLFVSRRLDLYLLWPYHD